LAQSRSGSVVAADRNPSLWTATLRDDGPWDGPVEGYPPEHRDFARIWQKAQKIVFSRTLAGATTRNTHVERDFGFDAIRKLKVRIETTGGHRVDPSRERETVGCLGARARREFQTDEFGDAGVSREGREVTG
jgi:hypothetical protein